MVMRKWLWRCAAAGVLTAAGAFWAMYYAWHHPDSYLGRCFSAAAQNGMLVNFLTGLSEATTDEEAVALAGEGGSLIPEDPIPVPPLDTPLLADMINPEAAPIEAPPPQITSSMPIVIEPSPLEAEVERTSVATLLQPPQESNSLSTENLLAHRPMIMPYAYDEDQPLRPMPFAEAEELSPVQADDPCMAWLHSWMGVLDQACASASKWTWPRADSLPSCQKDVHHHQQYPGCPYTGVPATDGPLQDRLPIAAPRQAEPEPTAGGAEETSDMLLRRLTPRLQKKLQELLPEASNARKFETPRPRGIDTMEFRPSDRTLSELAPGGPY
jgi:hypothetical protein